MSRPIGGPLPSPPVITLGCRLGIPSMRSMVNTGATSGASPWSDAANCLLAFPFVLEAPTTTFYKGFWCNGSAAGSNAEVGIWNEAYEKITTTGSVGGSGNNVPQSAALASTVTLPPGLYYAGMASNSTTTNRYMRWSVTGNLRFMTLLGCWRQSGITLGSLAATATPGALTNAGWPLFGLITRSGFDV